MLFSTLILALSEKTAVKVLSAADKFDIRDTALIDGVQESFQNDLLYIGYYAQVDLQNLPPHCVLAVQPGMPLPEPCGGDLAVTAEDRLFFLFNLAKSLLDAARGRGLYAELMDCAAQTGSISAFVNLAASKLGNSVVLVDRDYKVLAASGVYPIDDPIWAQNVRQGYCSYEFISAVSELESIKSAPNTPEAVAVTCASSPTKKLSSKIFRGGEMIGFVLMLEQETPLAPIHFELLPQVSAAAADMILRFAPYLLPDSTLYQRLLYDLLIGKPPEKLARVIGKLAFPAAICALRLSQTGEYGQKHLREETAERLRLLLPGTQLCFHENGIAALVPAEGASGLSAEQRAALTQLARAEGLAIGVSGTFGRVEDFAPRYAQARRALSLAARVGGGEPVCLYTELAFYDLLAAAGKAGELQQFCHPALERLRRYDADNGAELLHTLEAFLACDCSVKLTAERLFIHRNSLAYRLRRIPELTGLDLSDPGTRFLLEMSFAITRFGEGG